MINEFVDIYGKILRAELTKPKKHANSLSVVGCKYCHRIDKTLLKINNEYVCKDCAKQIEGV